MPKLPLWRPPRAPCTWCGGVYFNGHIDGSVHCAECESGSCDDLDILPSRGSLTPKAQANRRRLAAAGYVRRWTLAVGVGYIPGETSLLSHTYPEVIWTHDPTQEPSEPCS